MSGSNIADQLGRPLKDLRISLTDRCNMRCRYCMPAEIVGPDYPFLPSHEKLTIQEIARLASVFESIGVNKLRLTGGEPLMRRDAAELVALLRQHTTIEDIALTTNGLLLAGKAERLKTAGLSRVNLSLDALDDVVFRQMGGGRGSLRAVLDAVDACESLGIPVKINTVIRRGVNENEIIPLLKFGIRRDIEVRFIEYMDVGCSNGWDRSDVVTEVEILNRIGRFFGAARPREHRPSDVARTYLLDAVGYTFGVIASVSRPFCSGCVRARLSSDGKLHTCLFSRQGFDLKALLRSGATDRELVEGIRLIWQGRSDRYSEMRARAKGSRRKPEMSYLGG